MTEIESSSQPQLYDHYEVERILGRGAMGVVYLARDLRIGRHVALKTLQERHQPFDSPEAASDFLQRFRREAELCGSLIHPNIITLYEVGFESSRITYLAMEYVEGESLLSLLRRNGKLDLETAIKVTDDVLQGLAYAHDRGVIHRDIKPANILVTVEGQAKVADFGVARSARAALPVRTQEGQLLGTPYYMAPEHVAGRGVDARADLFSVGVVLFEMLSGKKPFEGPQVMDILYNVVNQPTPSLSMVAPEVPRWAAAFVERLLAKSPDDRFLSASAASRELRRLLATHRAAVETPLEMTVSVPVLRATTPEETPTTPLQRSLMKRLRERRVPRLPALGTVGVLLAAMVASIVAITSEIDEHPTALISEKALEEFEEKRVLIREAQILYNAGAYDASWRHFDQYLKRYPWSAAALEGRHQAGQAIDALRAQAKPAVAKIDVLEQRPRRKRVRRRTPGKVQPSGKAPATDLAELATKPEEPRLSLWARLKRFFRNAIRRPPPPAAAAQPDERDVKSSKTSPKRTGTKAPPTTSDILPGAQ